MLKMLMQVLQGSLPEEYHELREPSVPDLSYVLGQVHPLSVTLLLGTLPLLCLNNLAGF